MQKTWNWLPIILVGIASVVAVVASTYRLSESPRIWYDEGIFTQTAMNLSAHGTQALQIAPGTFYSAGTMTGGYPFVYPVSVAYTFFGAGVVQGRAVMVLFLLGFLVAAYVLLRLLYDPRSAAWGLLIIATFPSLYGDGKPVLGEVPGLLYLLLCLISLLYLERSRYQGLGLYVPVGLFAGLAVVTKPIFILFGPALLIAWFIKRREIRLSWGGCALGAVAFAVVAALWLYLQFGAGDSLAGILSFYANPYGETIGVSHILTQILVFFTGLAPLYLLCALGLWLGAFWLRNKAEISTAEFAAFSFCILVALAFLRLPGWYRYLFPALALALLFLPHAMERIFVFARERWVPLAHLSFLPAFLLGALVLAQLFQLYGHSYVADYYQSHRTSDMSAALAALPPESSFFLYNVPEIAVLLPNANYYQYLEPHPSQHIGEQELPLIANGNVDYVIAPRDAYTTQEAFFARYALDTNISRYDILKKR